MLQEGLSYFSDTHLTIVALFSFIVTFAGIVAWTYRKSARKYYDDMARLPLDERKPE